MVGLRYPPWLFYVLDRDMNIVEASYKHKDFLRQNPASKLVELLISGEVHIGRGLNQERGI